MNKFRDEYIETGYTIIRNRDTSSFVEKAQEILNCSDLENLHKFVRNNDINTKRLELSDSLSETKYKQLLFKEIERELSLLVGTELAVQKRFNTTLHSPHFENNITPFHSDVLCGNSPFEIVVWIPLTKVKDTQSMYIFDKQVTRLIINEMNSQCTRLELLNKYRDKLKYLELDLGDILIFSPTLIHGSEVNREDRSRVSLNIRFKNYHSPYAYKVLDEYFEPFQLSAQTILANEYNNEE